MIHKLNPRIQRIRIDRTFAREKNPNVMTPEAFQMLVGVIKTFGFLQPALARETKDLPPDQESVARLTGEGFWEIIDGAHRIEAARAAGLTEVDFVVVDSDAPADALRLEMNRLRGELNLSMVAQDLAALQATGWSKEDLTLTGFSLGEVDDLLKLVAQKTEDLADMGAVAGAEQDAEEPEEPQTTYMLEIPFGDKKQMAVVKRKLKKAGGGDVTKGLLQWAEEQG